MFVWVGRKEAGISTASKPGAFGIDSWLCFDVVCLLGSWW